ncbi:MAG: alpha/beta fold hydrolase [Nanoarchaeota archaeon]
MKKVFIIHGWGGNPKEPWFVWIKKELEKRNFKVIIPKMPNPNYPKINVWVSKLKKQIKNPDENTYLIGHSIGCQTILRYLQVLNKKIGGCIFVAGWFDLKNLEKEEKPIAKPWIKNKINFNKIKTTTKNFIAILSDNDPYGALNLNKKIFKNKLGAKVIIEHNKGHLSPDYNIARLPSALKAILNISK